MKIALLTSLDVRHRYFARVIRARFDVTAIAYEATGYDPSSIGASDLTPSERSLVRGHFEERARQERAHFGHDSDLIADSRACPVRVVDPGGLSTKTIVDLLRSRQVDTVVVYGTNLIRPPLLDAWPGRIVNLHLGLSPYYRGTATNFYPLLNEEPEYVGATIHVLDAGIDSGPILRHARPTIRAGDGPHVIGCRAILVGIAALTATLQEVEYAAPLATPQWKPKNARLYLRKDFHPSQVVALYRKLEDGLIERYLARLARGKAEVRLVNEWKDQPPGPCATECVSSPPAYATQTHSSLR